MDEMEKLKKTVSSGFLIDIGLIILAIICYILLLTSSSMFELDTILFVAAMDALALIGGFAFIHDRREILKNIENASTRLFKDITYLKTKFIEKSKNEEDWKKFLLKIKEIRNWVDTKIKEYYDMYPYNAFYGDQNISPIIESILSELYLEEVKDRLQNQFLLNEEEINIVLAKLDLFIDKCNIAEKIEEGFDLYVKQEEYENRIKNK